MEVRTILWPTDLSEGSFQAAPQVKSLAAKYDAEIVVMYVATDLCSYFPAYGNYPSSQVLGEFQDWELEHAKKRLEDLCQDMLGGCPRLRVRLVAGNAAREILKATKDEKADLVVMTSRGHTVGQENEIAGLGNVAREVIERSTVPVQVVYPDQPPP